MDRSANSSSSKTTDDFFDITKFPKIDTAFIATIWNEEQKKKQGSNSRRLARLIRSIEADISTPNEELDSFTYSEASSSLSVPAEQADDNPNSSSVGGTSYLTMDEIFSRIDDREEKDLRISKEKAVEVKREGDGNGSKQKLKKGRQRKQ